MNFSPAQGLCLLGAFQAFQLCVVALILKVENRRANGILALAIGIIGLLLFMGTFRFGNSELSSYRYEWIHAWGTLAMLVSPLIYLYIRVAIGGFHFRPQTFLHFLPALIHFCLLIPLWILTYEERAQLVETYLDLELYRSFLPRVRIGALQAVLYWIACFILVRRFERHSAQTASFSDILHLSWLKWLTHLLIVLLIMLALGRLIAFAYVEIIGIAAFTMFLTAVNITVMAKPELFQGIPLALQLPTKESSQEGNDGKYSNSSLDEPRKKAIASKLYTYFENESPYLNDALTLTDVSQALGISRNHVSQVVNEVFQKSFHDFVNEYRIEAAKKFLLDPEKDYLGIDGIALEVGFRSRSVFYSAFKKREGKSPAVWRKTV